VKRTKLTAEQMDRLIAIDDRQIELLEARMRQLGITDDELQAITDKADAQNERDMASGDWTIRLGNANYQYQGISADGNAQLTRTKD
jgi:hypothetical protein